MHYVTEVKADHILQLRTALEGARSHLGLSNAERQNGVRPAICDSITVGFVINRMQTCTQV